MSDARRDILQRIQRRLKRAPLSDSQRTALEQRLQRPARHTVPARARIAPAEQVALFVEMAEFAAASVQQTAHWRQVPEAVADFIWRHNLPAEIVLAPDPALTELDWDAQRRLRSVTARAARNGDRISVTTAVAGIAETGTLLLRSGPENPSTLNFLPDLHIVVLTTAQIVGPYEDAFERVRLQPIARTLNMITGPSRSADIEQTLQLGAHGPIQLHIVLVNESS